jgi:hypothetical protein
MDELDSLVIGKTLEGGWLVREPRHVQRDSPSACRAYVAAVDGLHWITRRSQLLSRSSPGR